MVKICGKFPEDLQENYNEYFSYFNFPLSDFQKWAIVSIVRGQSCLITSHTGAGKTVSIEFAFQYLKQANKKLIYTGPIKALCNQKLYDFRRKYPHISFGLLTGDIKDNPEADVLIMTTEILRNTLFNKQICAGAGANSSEKERGPVLNFEMDFATELGAVAFDEVHYIADEDRGSVWEQSILMLPKHIQLIMLSATIDKPENFARWVEVQKGGGGGEEDERGAEAKQVYLCSTLERVVPLKHYMWLSCHQNTIKEAKGTPLEADFKNMIRKPISILSNDKLFNEENYYKMMRLKAHIEKLKGPFIKRHFVLNDLAKYLKNNGMLPGLCFIFSRKNVERSAKEINISLFNAKREGEGEGEGRGADESKIPSIIENECRQILMRKIPNYKEYVELPEFIELMGLLKKGIAIHHAGMPPILREIVEILFEKHYIKLLFATETFAVGINMPTKTVIFTDLAKFDGNGKRDLQAHEYTQMAGRAGRRGIDTIGHVIHCNNLFSLNIGEFSAYKKMLTGGAKKLTSKFKISYNLLLSIIYRNRDKSVDLSLESFKNFINRSMFREDLDCELTFCRESAREIAKKMQDLENIIDYLKTPREIMENYAILRGRGRGRQGQGQSGKHAIQAKLTNNERKKRIKQMADIESSHKNLANDMEKYDEYLELFERKDENDSYESNVFSYIDDNIDKNLKILRENEFISMDAVASTIKILDKGIISSQVQEVHSLLMGELYIKSQGFMGYSSEDLVALFSCFTNIKVDDTLKTYNTYKIREGEGEGNSIEFLLKQAKNIYETYEILERENHLLGANDTEDILHFDLLEYMYGWCKADKEEDCKVLIERIKREKNIFLGDFVKAIIKINNIAVELEKVCEMLNNMELKERLSRIGGLTLKYVATNQSLYV
jgi:superfamily II RNA helicase